MDEVPWETELQMLHKAVEALEQIGTDPGARERVLRYLIARFWPAGVERIVFIGKDKTETATPPAEVLK